MIIFNNAVDFNFYIITFWILLFSIPCRITQKEPIKVPYIAGYFVTMTMNPGKILSVAVLHS